MNIRQISPEEIHARLKDAIADQVNAAAWKLDTAPGADGDPAPIEFEVLTLPWGDARCDIADPENAIGDYCPCDWSAGLNWSGEPEAEGTGDDADEAKEQAKEALIACMVRHLTGVAP